MERVRELDGVRGLAILLVILYHVAPYAETFTGSPIMISVFNSMQIGWLGVDLFFVLSGFLITDILLRAREKSNYFKNFYARRILRIFPVYYVVVGLLLIFLPLLETTRGIQEQSSWPFFVFYQQNWLYILKRPVSAYLTVTWSLAIEEQFYLIWPTIVKWLDNRKLAIVASVAFVFSLGLRLFISHLPLDLNYAEKINYYATFTRLDGLMIGALIAIAYQSQTWKNWLPLLAWPVFGLSLLAMIFILTGKSTEPFSKNTMITTWSFSALALFGGSLIVLLKSLSENNWLRISFRNGILGFFGKYSYAMYLVHAPIIFLLNQQFLKANLKGAVTSLSLVAASIFCIILVSLLSWNLLEKRVLNLKAHFE